jgi:hypothetical protein
VAGKETEWKDPETGETHVFNTTNDCLAFFRKRCEKYEARPAPAIRPDSIEMWNPIDGKIATSKSRYYKQVRQAGCVIDDRRTDDVANSTAKEPKPPDNIGRDIKNAYDQLESR